jgi:hypothetical protein
MYRIVEHTAELQIELQSEFGTAGSRSTSDGLLFFDLHDRLVQNVVVKE